MAAKKKEHPYSTHPAVGLLDCVRGVDGKKFEDPRGSGLCDHCGFDEPFHELEVDDYTGAYEGEDGDRPPHWEKLKEAVAKDGATQSFEVLRKETKASARPPFQPKG